MPAHPHTGPGAQDGRRRTGRCAQRIRPEPCGGCSAPRNIQELHQQHASVGAMDPHQSRLGSTLHARTLLADLLGAGQHPHPAAGHEVLAACFKDLQPAVLVAVALVVQASTGGIGSLCPDLIHQPLRGSLWLQLPDRQWVPCCCVNGLTVKHQRVARVLTVVRDDQSVAHERVLLSPFLSRDHAASVNPAMVLLSLAADQLSAPTSTVAAVSSEPSGLGLKQVPLRSAA